MGALLDAAVTLVFSSCDTGVVLACQSSIVFSQPVSLPNDKFTCNFVSLALR